MGRRNRKPKSRDNIDIIDIGDKGKAVGQCENGEIVLIEGAIPGQNISASLFKKRKGIWQGRIEKINTESPYKVLPNCSHFGVCGGCKWQNLSYSKQIELKDNYVRQTLKRIGKVNNNQIYLPILGCEDPYFYRNKLEFTFSNKRWLTTSEITTEKKISDFNALGFHRPGAFDKVVDVEKCYLQQDLHNAIRNFIKLKARKLEISHFDIRHQTGGLRNLIIRNTSLGEWMVIVSFYEVETEKKLALLDAIHLQFPEITALLSVINPKGNDTIFDLEIEPFKGKDYIVEQLGKIKYKIGPKSFFQTNSVQAGNLFDIALQFADLQPQDTMYDLYTGLGSIALYASVHCKQVVGIEEIPEAIEDARENTTFNAISNCHFYAGDVRDVLTTELISHHGMPDVIMTDPPRAGMSEDVINFLLEIECSKIVYISCNPATQARDINLLSTKYVIQKSRAVDMFPHTSHVENVVLLILKNLA